MFPFLVNSVLLFFFLSLSFKSPPFTSPRNQKRARYRIKTTITLRLGLYIYFFFCFGIFILFAHCYLFWLNHSMDSRRNIRRRYENCCVLFSLWLCVVRIEYTHSNTTEKNQRAREEIPIADTHFFLIFMNHHDPMKKYDGREKTDRMKRRKKHNITSIELLIPLSDKLDQLAFD